jgi:hypothetical protein
MEVISDTQMLIYRIVAGIMVYQTIMFAIFASFGFLRYSKRKGAGKVSLYYALVNLLYLIATTTSNIGILDVLEYGVKTDLYEMSLVGMNVGIIITSMFLYFFYYEMGNPPKRNRILALVFAIIISGIQVLAYFYGKTYGLKYIGYTTQTVYCAAIYLAAAKGFNFLRKNIPEQSKDFGNIMLSYIFNVIYFVSMLTRAFIPADSIAIPVIQIGSWIIQITSVLLLFFGFMYPTIRKSKQPKEEGKEE